MALFLEVKVIPSAGRFSCVREVSGMLKCRLKNPPERGKANKELVTAIARALRIPLDLVVIVSGQTSRRKRLRIDAPVTEEMVLDALGVARQMQIGEG